jgi:lipopolysaccharide/colanic/teichoic acid biosynthesis glycosyltransferase
VAGARLIVLAPLLALVAAAIRLTSGSPVIFRQQRPGLHGRPFALSKFRTMTDAGDADGRPLPDRLRLTRLGRKLQTTNLDELPEPFNVVKGEMSLVEPRAPPDGVSGPLHDGTVPATRGPARNHGWAQSNGRNTVPRENRLALDVWYVENLTFWLDLRILIGTVRRPPGGRAAWRRDGSRVSRVLESGRIAGRRRRRGRAPAGVGKSLGFAHR